MKLFKEWLRHYFSVSFDEIKTRSANCGPWPICAWMWPVFQPVTTLKRLLKVYGSFISVLIGWKWATFRSQFWSVSQLSGEKSCKQNFFKNFTEITYERMLKKLKIGRQISCKNKRFPINSLGLASLGLVRHLVCKQCRIYVCFFPKWIHFHSYSLGSACNVQSPEHLTSLACHVIACTYRFSRRITSQLQNWAALTYLCGKPRNTISIRCKNVRMLVTLLDTRR